MCEVWQHNLGRSCVMLLWTVQICGAVSGCHDYCCELQQSAAPLSSATRWHKLLQLCTEFGKSVCRIGGLEGVVECCGGLWRVVEGCGGLWIVVEGCEVLWRVVEGCGGLWRVVEGCGGL